MSLHTPADHVLSSLSKWRHGESNRKVRLQSFPNKNHGAKETVANYILKPVYVLSLILITTPFANNFGLVDVF